MMLRWIRRQLNLLDFALFSLRRRKARNLALVLVYTLVVFWLGSVIFFSRAMQNQAGKLLKDSPEILVQRLCAGRHELIPLEYLDQIRAIRGVQQARERLWGYYYDPGSQANYTIMVEASQGSGLEPGWIMVGSGVLRSFAAKDQESLTFRSYRGDFLRLRVKEVFSSDSELLTSDLILMEQGDFKKLFGFPEGFATDLVVEVRNPKERSTVAEKIAQSLPDTRPILRDEILRTYQALFDWRGGMALMLLISAVLAFLILAWDKATGLSADEKKEIGILKATGWETGDVMLLKALEGMVLSLSAFLCGTLFAYLHVFHFSWILMAPALRGWAVLYPRFPLDPSFGPGDLAVLFFLTVAPYTVATMVPCWKAATTDPDRVMRGQI